MNSIKIAITSDHAGYLLKTKLIKYFNKKSYSIIDLGTDSDKSIDYPEFGHALARLVKDKKCDFGISICGSGNGINMVVNKHLGIRAALCWNEDISRLARTHNDANICALPGRFINFETAIVIIETFIETEFDGGRHERRIKKIDLIN